MMNETAIHGLAFIGAVGSAVWIMQSLKSLVRRSQAETEMVPASGPRFTITPDPSENDAAVIAAAVYAVMSSSLTVRIDNDNRSKHWAAEGRWMHQMSHRPH